MDRGRKKVSGKIKGVWPLFFVEILSGGGHQALYVHFVRHTVAAFVIELHIYDDDD